MQCQACKNEMQLVDEKETVIEFTIPILKWEVLIMKDVKNWLCVECATDKHQESERAIFDQGVEHGYEKAINDYRTGNWRYNI